MKNIFVVTLGTRDVQILLDKASHLILDNKLKIGDDEIELKFDIGFPNYASIKEPRVGGKALLSIDYSAIEDYLCFPLIEDALEEYVVKTKTKIILVFTNQESEHALGHVSDYHYNCDTLFFQEIISNWILKKFSGSLDSGSIGKVEIKERVTDIDFHYNKFEKDLIGRFNIRKEDIEQVYLLAQGGIDQINFALTLKLIENLPGRVTQLQKAENKDPLVINFPNLFINNLTKHQLRKMLLSWDFNGIQQLSTNKEINKIAEFGEAILNLNIDKIILLQDVQFENGALNKYLRQLQDLIRENNLSAKINLLINSISILMFKNGISDVVWRLSALYELIMQFEIKVKYPAIDFDNPKVFDSVLKDDVALIEFLTKKGVEPFKGNYGPNKMVLKSILEFKKFSNNTRLLIHLALFTSFRDAVVHKAIGVTVEQINIFLNEQKPKTSLLDVINEIEQSKYNIVKNIPKLIETSISQRLNHEYV